LPTHGELQCCAPSICGSEVDVGRVDHGAGAYVLLPIVEGERGARHPAVGEALDERELQAVIAAAEVRTVAEQEPGLSTPSFRMYGVAVKPLLVTGAPWWKSALVTPIHEYQ